MRLFYTLLLLVKGLIQAKGDTCVGTFVETGCLSLSNTMAECGSIEDPSNYAIAIIYESGEIIYGQCYVFGELCANNQGCDPPTTD